MLKQYGIVTAVAIFVFCFCASAVFAQCGSCDLEAKLKDLQAQKEQVTQEYRAAVNKANSEADGKIKQLKRDYKKACAECNKERDMQCGEFKKGYDAKMQPVSAEEKQVMSAMAPNQRMNFAKPKSER